MLMLTKRIQHKDIAKQIGVSEGTISNDIKALEDDSDQFL
jgi:hypothetical protein